MSYTEREKTKTQSTNQPTIHPVKAVADGCWLEKENEFFLTCFPAMCVAGGVVEKFCFLTGGTNIEECTWKQEILGSTSWWWTVEKHGCIWLVARSHTPIEDLICSVLILLGMSLHLYCLVLFYLLLWVCWSKLSFLSFCISFHVFSEFCFISSQPPNC